MKPTGHKGRGDGEGTGFKPPNLTGHPTFPSLQSRFQLSPTPPTNPMASLGLQLHVCKPRVSVCC
ncbi:integrator complex subunit 2 [Corchorus olitorius]|uniref:Integrator complex subunit 2 n=1 Tax=Corchorus olitorius TaxID=93759 RepID=A0A1R3IE35_9ROSI|nr:integrator complex subunit 2 [Corchorus olitorius]